VNAAVAAPVYEDRQMGEVENLRGRVERLERSLPALIEAVDAARPRAWQTGKPMRNRMVVKRLARVVPADPGKPARAEARSTQEASRSIAENPSQWSPQMAHDVVAHYRELAAVWNDERGNYRPVPLADALARGGPLPPGLCLELGCGTGLLTPLLSRVWAAVLSLDLTEQMLRNSAARWRVLADASKLPVPDGQAAAVVLADVPLFAEEVVRVLAPHGIVIWSNALGVDAPHHVPLDTVRAALVRASSAPPWTAVTADAGWGMWAVLRRSVT
jgi:SAM-dependent methyltransferase